MRTLAPAFALAALIPLAGCATGYHRAKSAQGRGYFDYQVQDQEDTYVVGFRGNRFTNAQRRHRYVLRRASELTLASNNRYFMFLEEQPKEGQLFRAFREPPAEPPSKLYDAAKIKAEIDDERNFH